MKNIIETMYTISFIIPVLNGEKHIRQCLDHILREMNDNDEIIVVDNGSTDDTLKIIEHYKKVKVLVFPKVTIAALRNRGADIAKGDILAFIDSDCLVCEGWRKAVIEIMKNTDVAATGSTTIIPKSATWVEKAWLSQRKSYDIQASYINSGNFIIRNDIFVNVSGFNESFITDEDTDICRRINERGYIIIDSPNIKAIHLNNSKTIIEFFARQLWHSSSIFSVSSLFRIDKPLIMTYAFILSCFFGLALFILNYNNIIYMACAVGILLVVPTITALYRAISFCLYRYLIYLIILYIIFYFSRSVALLIFLNKRLWH